MKPFLSPSFYNTMFGCLERLNVSCNTTRLFLFFSPGRPRCFSFSLTQLAAIHRMALNCLVHVPRPVNGFFFSPLAAVFFLIAANITTYLSHPVFSSVSCKFSLRTNSFPSSSASLSSKFVAELYKSLSLKQYTCGQIKVLRYYGGAGWRWSRERSLRLV